VSNWTKQLCEKNWTEWVTNRVDEIQRNPFNGCKLVFQVQPYGKNSMLRINGDDQTAFSWRDSTIGADLNIFYNGEDSHKIALEWHQKNDMEAKGKEGRFCNEDRRFLWGSYDEDLTQVHQYYFEKGKWERLLEIKKKWDPQNIFSPNKFGINEEIPKENLTDVNIPETVAHDFEYQMVNWKLNFREKHLIQKKEV